MIRETINLVNRRKSEGCIAVEMEAVGVQTVCDYYGLDLYDFFSAGDDNMRQYILNIYLTLMTRGIEGTYIYAVDEDLRKYLHKFFNHILTTKMLWSWQLMLILRSMPKLCLTAFI